MKKQTFKQGYFTPKNKEKLMDNQKDPIIYRLLNCVKNT